VSLAHPTPSRVFGPSAVVVTRRGASAQSPLWPRSPKSEVKPHSEHLIMKIMVFGLGLSRRKLLFPSVASDKGGGSVTLEEGRKQV